MLKPSAKQSPRGSSTFAVEQTSALDLCEGAGHGIGQTSRRGCLYSSAEGHARVCPKMVEVQPGASGTIGLESDLCCGVAGSLDCEQLLVMG